MKAIFLLAGKKPSVVDGAQAGSLAYMIIDDEGWTFKKEEDFKHPKNEQLCGLATTERRSTFK